MIKLIVRRAVSEGSFDVVLLPDVIEHIADEARCAAVTARLLRPAARSS